MAIAAIASKAIVTTAMKKLGVKSMTHLTNKALKEVIGKEAATVVKKFNTRTLNPQLADDFINLREKVKGDLGRYDMFKALTELNEIKGKLDTLTPSNQFKGYISKRNKERKAEERLQKRIERRERQFQRIETKEQKQLQRQRDIEDKYGYNKVIRNQTNEESLKMYNTLYNRINKRVDNLPDKYKNSKQVEIFKDDTLTPEEVSTLTPNEVKRELRKLVDRNKWQSLNRQGASLIEQRGVYYFGNKYKDLTPEQQSAVWNQYERIRQSNPGYSSDQVQEYVKRQFNDPDTEILFETDSDGSIKMTFNRDGNRMSDKEVGDESGALLQRQYLAHAVHEAEMDKIRRSREALGLKWADQFKVGNIRDF